MSRCRSAPVSSRPDTIAWPTGRRREVVVGAGIRDAEDRAVAIRRVGIDHAELIGELVVLPAGRGDDIGRLEPNEDAMTVVVVHIGFDHDQWRTTSWRCQQTRVGTVDLSTKHVRDRCGLHNVTGRVCQAESGRSVGQPKQMKRPVTRS